MEVRTYPNFARASLVNAALATWPEARWSHWHRYTGQHGEKLASKDPARLPFACLELIRHMAGVYIPDAEAFPDFDLHGAGMHWIREGGSLPLHTDAMVHPTLGWRRRFNAVLYLDSCEGGELVFRDSRSEPSVSVRPEKNMLVVFPVSHPHEVLTVKSGERRSLSLFWWSVSNADAEGSVSATWAGAL